MSKSFVVALTFLALGTPANLLAEQVTDAIHLARAFVGYCGQNPGRNDQISAAAMVLGFLPLDEEQKTMLGPEDPNIDYQGWMVSDEGFSPYLLGVSEGLAGGHVVSNCVVANPNIPMTEVLTEIQRLLEFGPSLDDFSSAGQHYRVWSTNSIAEGSWIAVVDSPEMGVVGGTIALSTRKGE